MYFKVWGSRGSLPAPAQMDFDTRRFGGQTTCFEIRCKYGDTEELFIIDMGTGIRDLGNHLLERLKRNEIEKIKARIFMTHNHLDHTFGMGFFIPLFIPGHEIEFYALDMSMVYGNLANQLSSLIDGIQFPRTLDQLPSIAHNEGREKAMYNVKFWDVLEFETVLVNVFELNHPGGCAGWRFQERAPDGTYTGAVLGIGTDTEHYSHTNPNVQRLGANADLIIVDGQYEEDEYYGLAPDRSDSKQGWGHGTPRACVREASECGAKRVGITHHDPAHDDRTIAKMETKARVYNRRLKKPVPEVFFLREGMEITF